MLAVQQFSSLSSLIHQHSPSLAVRLQRVFLLEQPSTLTRSRSVLVFESTEGNYFDVRLTYKRKIAIFEKYTAPQFKRSA